MFQFVEPEPDSMLSEAPPVRGTDIPCSVRELKKTRALENIRLGR